MNLSREQTRQSPPGTRSERVFRSGVVTFGPYELDLDGFVLYRDRRPVHLTTLPLRVLASLVVHASQIVSRDDLRREVWGDEVVLGFDDRLNTCIATIRTTLGDSATEPTYIETVRGRGYRFIALVSKPAAAKRSSPRRVRSSIAATAVAVGMSLALSGDVERSHNDRSTPEAVGRGVLMTTSDPYAWSLFEQAVALTRNMREPDYREAVRLLEIAVDRDPGFALGHARLALATLQLSWLYADATAIERAEQAAHRAVTLAPERAEPWLALGAYHYYGGRRYEAALKALRRAERIASDDAEIVSTIGYVLRRQGRWRESITCLERAATIDPHSLEIRRALGQAYARIRDYTAAEHHLRIALALAPDHGGLHIDLAEVALLSGQGPEPALQILAAGAVRTESSVGSLLVGSPMLARVLADRVRRPSQAVADPGRPRDDIGDTGRVGLAAAWLHARLGNPAEARRQYEAVYLRLTRRDRERPIRGLSEERANLALAAAALGHPTEARDHVEALLREFSFEWDAMQAGFLWRTAAEALVVAGEHEHAAKIVERLLALPAPMSAALLRIDPIWAPLRGDPRFRGVVD